MSTNPETENKLKGTVEKPKPSDYIKAHVGMLIREFRVREQKLPVNMTTTQNVAEPTEEEIEKYYQVGLQRLQLFSSQDYFSEEDVVSSLKNAALQDAEWVRTIIE